MNKNQIHERPTPDSYWVIPHKLAAGGYPRSRFLDEQTIIILNKLLGAGVMLFLDLTRPGELVSYRDLLMKEAKRLGVEVEYRRVPIHDRHCPSKETMVDILDTIDDTIQEGCGVYVHCWGGIGRTGTVVGCYLVRHGIAGQGALDTIARSRDGLPSGRLRSPETDEQCEMVLSWQAGL
ncbi:MAG: dual specificity protein phosphatase family protein [Anaerolineaceae bacterium]|nr:dual specificity protein phosphatase family protein [Anaerolineaceae bacterium]